MSNTSTRVYFGAYKYSNTLLRTGPFAHMDDAIVHHDFSNDANGHTYEAALPGSGGHTRAHKKDDTSPGIFQDVSPANLVQLLQPHGDDTSPRVLMLYWKDCFHCQKMHPELLKAYKALDKAGTLGDNAVFATVEVTQAHQAQAKMPAHLRKLFKAADGGDVGVPTLFYVDGSGGGVVRHVGRIDGVEKIKHWIVGLREATKDKRGTRTRHTKPRRLRHAGSTPRKP